ncbi:methylmalonyl-CoA mutase family protein [Formosa sp. 4Alg 33]|uniref:methylmalonyl-CoA mutase family protein n=1 Tax=Formosa sp. 4Alg 33 TaxID=3382189 RepID=UPI003D9C39BF
MSRKDLQHISLNSAKNQAQNSCDEANFQTEHHALISGDSDSDFEFGAGIPPFLRGISSTMYIRSPWDIQQTAHLNVVEDYNAFYKRNFEAGQRHFVLDFICNSDETICVETLDQFISVFKDIPLDAITISIKNNAKGLVYLAFYIATAEAQNLNIKDLKGSFIVDALEGLNLFNTANSSKNTIAEILDVTKSQTPLFNGISICNDTLRHASQETELAVMLISANNLLKNGVDSGLKIDHIASRLSLNFGVGMNHFSDISKLRAARLLWAKVVKTYQPNNGNALALHIHCKAKPVSDSNSNSENAVTQATIGALTSVFGGTQSLETQTVIPSTLESDCLDKNIQLFLQKETQITKTVDPWAGSFYIEKRTQELSEKAWSIFETYQNSNILSDTVTSELIKKATEHSALKKTTPSTKSTPIHRDENSVADTLPKLTEAFKKNDENRLTLAIKAVKSKATFSEICKVAN